MSSPIHHTFAPLADSRQVRLACRLTFMPWMYRNEAPVKQLEKELMKKCHGDAVAFGSGRESLLALLRAYDFEKGDEIIVQGYTCVVVPNAVHAAGLKVVYVDIERDTLNLDVDEVEKAITGKTRAIICQHTFGIPADTKKLRMICDRHKLLLIEDCAHVLPDHHGPAQIGVHGDASILSFGRDKAISGVTGGAVVTKDSDVALKLRVAQSNAHDLPMLQIFALLQYPLVYAIARPLYGVLVGKALLLLASKVKLLIPILTSNEKRGTMSQTLTRMPGPCALLALDQLHRLDALNEHRRTITHIYARNHTIALHAVAAAIQKTDGVYLPLQKLPLFVKQADSIRHALKRNNVHLFDGWTGCVICPDTVDGNDACYGDGTDPVAERACEQILNLPTHPTMTEAQAERLLTFLHPLIKP